MILSTIFREEKMKQKKIIPEASRPVSPTEQLNIMSRFKEKKPQHELVTKAVDENSLSDVDKNVEYYLNSGIADEVLCPPSQNTLKRIVKHIPKKYTTGVK